MTQIMRTPRSLFMALGFLWIATFAVGATEAEMAAVKGLETMNRNRGAEFVSIAHPKVVQKMRDTMLALFENGARRGSKLRELKYYGVATIEDFKALDPETVARITIDHMNDQSSAQFRELAHKVKIAAVSSKTVDDTSVVVTLSLDIGDGQPKTVKVLSKLDGEVWKYWGFPELVKR